MAKISINLEKIKNGKYAGGTCVTYSWPKRIPVVDIIINLEYALKDLNESLENTRKGRYFSEFKDQGITEEQLLSSLKIDDLI